MVQTARTVLIVDDSPEDCELYRRYLQRDGDYHYTFLTAHLAEEGLDLWQKHRPDALLLDYRLPDLDGLELLAALQAAARRPYLPVIMVTGQGSETTAVQAMKEGAQDYLIKGQITPEGLRLAVNEVIEKVQLRTELHQRIERERLVSQITQQIHRSLDLGTILQTTVDEVLQFLHTDRIIIFRLEPSGSGTVVTEAVRAGWPSILSAQIYDPCFAETYVDRYQQGLVTAKSDIEDGSIEPCHAELLKQFQVKANLVVPILQEDRLWGMIMAHHCATPRPWQPLEVELLRELANQVGIVLQQAELYQQLQRELLERQQAEAALRESEFRFRQLAENIDAVFWITALPTRQVLYISPAYERLWQLNRQDIYEDRQRWVDLIHPEDRAMVERAFEEHAAAGRFDQEYRIVLPSGQIRWVHDRCFPLKDEAGEVLQFTGIAEDISDRKCIEGERERLLQREQHYASQLRALTQAALAISSVTTIGEVLHIINDEAHSIIGCHQAMTSLNLDQNRSQAIDAVYLSAKYQPWCTDGELPRAGIDAGAGQLSRPLRLSQAELETHPQWRGFSPAAGKHPPLRGWLAVPLFTRDGQNLGLIQLSDKIEGEFTAEDEAVLVQLAQLAAVAIENIGLYEAAQAARAAAEQANRVKDEFLAVLSHELRSPLNPILGWTKLLQARPFTPEKTADALAVIARNAQLQTQLIDDLLDIAKILRGKLNLEVVPVDLASVIEFAIDTVSAAAKAKSILIHPTLNPVGLVLGDAARLQQIVWNLLSNAIKFTPAGGRIDVCLEHIEQQAQITVSDTGKGIVPDFLPHIFESFRQEDVSTTRKYGGLGLGLAIVRQLVEAHGGIIAATSTGEGAGATFTVRIPVLSGAVAPCPAPALPDQDLELRGLRILAADDGADSRELLTELLQQYGAEVLTVSSGVAVLASLESFRPDLLISDIGMPDMDGYTLMQHIRALPPDEGGQLPAIAVTAYARADDRERALANGFQQHLAKPVEPARLVRAVAALVRRP